MSTKIEQPGEKKVFLPLNIFTSLHEKVANDAVESRRITGPVDKLFAKRVFYILSEALSLRKNIKTNQGEIETIPKYSGRYELCFDKTGKLEYCTEQDFEVAFSRIIDTFRIIEPNKNGKVDFQGIKIDRKNGAKVLDELVDFLNFEFALSLSKGCEDIYTAPQILAQLEDQRQELQRHQKTEELKNLIEGFGILENETAMEINIEIARWLNQIKSSFELSENLSSRLVDIKTNLDRFTLFTGEPRIGSFTSITPYVDAVFDRFVFGCENFSNTPGVIDSISIYWKTREARKPGDFGLGYDRHSYVTSEDNLDNLSTNEPLSEVDFTKLQQGIELLKQELKQAVGISEQLIMPDLESLL
jgi:hypothetical protein